MCVSFYMKIIIKIIPSAIGDMLCASNIKDHSISNSIKIIPSAIGDMLCASNIKASVFDFFYLFKCH